MSSHTCTEHEPSASCFRRHGCRCTGCYADARRRKKLSRNGLCGMVDAAPIRRHILALQARGYRASGIATAAGVSTNLITYTLTTARKVHAATARKILAVEEPSGVVDATGTRRRIQALIALGWTFSALASRLGYTRAAVHHWTRHDSVTTASAAAARQLYDELWDQPPPPGMAATRNRNLAARSGWPPPMAWDDDLIDDPTGVPGDWHRTDRLSVSREDVIEAAELGASLAALVERFGTPAAIERALYRAGRGDLWHRINPRERRVA